MTNILESKTVLQLNASWLPIGTRTVREAILAMNAAQGDVAMALDIEYNPLGLDFDFSKPSSIIPYRWDDWLQLPIRPYDNVIHSAKLTVRAPTVIVASNYRKMPVKTHRVNGRSLKDRDGGICQYSGKYIGNNGNIDHVIPLSRGGSNAFENTVWCDPEINSQKGDKTPEEAGLKLLRKPKAPLPMPMSMLITHAAHDDWKFFLPGYKDRA